MSGEDDRYAGIYMISKVSRGGGKLHKAPTYTVIARWSKEAAIAACSREINHANRCLHCTHDSEQHIDIIVSFRRHENH